MTTAQLITLLIGSAFVVALAYKLNEIRREPSNLGAWAVVVILLALTIATTIRDGAPTALGAYGVETLGVLLRNVAQVLGFAGLQLWHLRHLPKVSSRRFLLEAALLAGALVAMCILTATLPAGVGLTWSNANLAHFHVLVFYYVAGGYVLYCLAWQLRWNIRFAREFKQRLLKTSAVITALGDLFLICTQLSRQASQNYNHFVSGVRPRITTILELTFVALGMPLLIIGLLLPPVVGLARAIIAFVKVIGLYRVLRHLHAAVKWAYPGMIRPRRMPEAGGGSQPAAAESRLLRNPVEAARVAYTERLQQCREGYSRNRNSEGEGGRPAALARTLDSLPESRVQVDLSDEKEQIAHLVAVSRALRRIGPTYAAPGAR